MQDESTEEAIDAEKNDMEIRHKVYRGIWDSMKVYTGGGMKYLEFGHV